MEASIYSKWGIRTGAVTCRHLSKGAPVGVWGPSPPAQRSPEDSCPSCHLGTCSSPTSSSSCEVAWIQESFLPVQMWDHNSISLSERKTRFVSVPPMTAFYFHSFVHSIIHSSHDATTAGYTSYIVFLPEDDKRLISTAHSLHLSPHPPGQPHCQHPRILLVSFLCMYVHFMRAVFQSDIFTYFYHTRFLMSLLSFLRLSFLIIQFKNDRSVRYTNV